MALQLAFTQSFPFPVLWYGTSFKLTDFTDCSRLSEYEIKTGGHHARLSCTSCQTMEFLEIFAFSVQF